MLTALLSPSSRCLKMSPRWLVLRRLCLLLSLISGLTSGCMTTSAYQPNPRRWAELGRERAQEQLEAVLQRSLNPPINAVEITDTFVRVDLTNTTYQVRVFFRDVHQAEIFTNHLVILRGNDNRLLFRPIFTNDQDAQLFADLMLSWNKT